jgi:MFS family permease
MPTFLTGLFIAAAGYAVLAIAKISNPSFVFFGIFLFAIGEMMASPRIQEYITWIAPKEKAGLYMGSNFLATSFGGLFSGFVYTTLYGFYNSIHHPEFVWYTLAIHLFLGIIAITWFTKTLGEFKELDY